MGMLLLTGCRRNEVMEAEWSEFDLPNGVWRIPARRRKTEHALDMPNEKVAPFRHLAAV